MIRSSSAKHTGPGGWTKPSTSQRRSSCCSSAQALSVAGGSGSLDKSSKDKSMPKGSAAMAFGIVGVSSVMFHSKKSNHGPFLSHASTRGRQATEEDYIGEMVEAQHLKAHANTA